MGKYDRYAKDVLRETFGERFSTTDDVVFSFGPDAGTGEVDGTIDGKVAVEIGVGSPKQVRASVLDLMFHPFPMKLLILVDTPEHETGRSVRQAGAILAQASKPGVVLRLAGTPSNPLLEVDGNRLADVVNMYVGEPEKNLVRLVDVADAFDSILLFDEADDLFGRPADGCPEWLTTIPSNQIVIGSTTLPHCR